MISIWPQNHSLPAGLAGSRAFVFPPEWPVSCPPRNSSQVGANKRANYYIRPQASNTRRRILLKICRKKKNTFAIASGFMDKYNRIVSAAVSRLLSRKPAPQWPTGGPRMVVPGGRIGALESSQSPFLGLQTRVSLVNPFLSFCVLFFTPLSLLPFGIG